MYLFTQANRDVNKEGMQTGRMVWLQRGGFPGEQVKLRAEQRDAEGCAHFGFSAFL